MVAEGVQDARNWVLAMGSDMLFQFVSGYSIDAETETPPVQEPYYGKATESYRDVGESSRVDCLSLC